MCNLNRLFGSVKANLIFNFVLKQPYLIDDQEIIISSNDINYNLFGFSKFDFYFFELVVQRKLIQIHLFELLNLLQNIPIDDSVKEHPVYLIEFFWTDQKVLFEVAVVSEHGFGADELKGVIPALVEDQEVRLFLANEDDVEIVDLGLVEETDYRLKLVLYLHPVEDIRDRAAEVRKEDLLAVFQDELIVLQQVANVDRLHIIWGRAFLVSRLVNKPRLQMVDQIGLQDDLGVRAGDEVVLVLTRTQESPEDLAVAEDELFPETL